MTTFDEWRAKAEADRNGRSLTQLNWETGDGFELGPLATREDAESLPHRAATGLLRARRGWRARELVTCAEPDDAARRIRAAIDGGMDEVELCLDSLVQDGRDPTPFPTGDEPFDEDGAIAHWAAPGDGGVAVHCYEDLARALDGVDLGSTSVSFSAGEGTLPALAWVLHLADDRGVPGDALVGTLDVDPIARLTTRRPAVRADDRVVARRSSVDSVFDETTAVVRLCQERCAGVRPLCVDGQAYHLAGANPALEVGLTIASAIDVARRVGARGVSFDEFARAATIRMQVSHELLPQIAKLRALRLLWAKVAHGFGASEAALVPSLLGVTSGRFVAETYDQRSNLIRSTLASVAAIGGGCDGLIAMPYAEDAPDAARLARDQHNLLRHEGHLDRVADPFGGASTIELLTDQIGRAAWDVVRDVEARGGFVESVRTDEPVARLDAAESERDRTFRTRRRALVGISRFADLELGGAGPNAWTTPLVPDAPNAAVEPFQAWLTRRDAAAASAFVARLEDAGPRGIAAALDADCVHASAAQITTASWPEPGTEFAHWLLPNATTDGYDFEELRAWAEAAAEDQPLPTVLLLPLGAPRAARARADFARDLFQVAGLPVIDPQMFDSVDAAVEAVRAHAPAIAVLCGRDEDYAGQSTALRAALGEATPRLIVAGEPGEGAAVDGTVHAGMDVVEFLERIQRELGVRDDD